MTVSNDCGEQKEEQKKSSADRHHQLMVGETCIKVMESRNTESAKISLLLGRRSGMLDMIRPCSKEKY